ncbi:MAG: hypothetical protein ACQERB_11345 [Promethearchaeati archaeon]
MFKLDKCRVNCDTKACWNACEDYLKEKIDRSKYVNDIRKELLQKRREKHKYSKIS